VARELLPSAAMRVASFVLLFVAACSSGSGDDAIPPASATPPADNAVAPPNAPPPPGTTTPPAPPPPPPMPVPYTNAVLAKDCPDPGVLASGGMFYMTCTGGKFEIRSSKDLVTWTDTGSSILPSGKAPWAADGNRNWAPEIHEVSPGAFVAYFTASDAQGHLAIGAASATSPTGPFTDRGGPLVQNATGVIDATFFADDDGKKYLYWKLDGNSKGQPTPIFAEELTADGLSFAAGASAHQVLVNDAATWEGGVVEAPWVIKRSGTYFLFYSGNVYDQRYRTGVARASSPTATFTKKGTPILDNNNDWVGPGHGSVVTVGTSQWFVHHAWPTDGAGNRDANKGREVLLDAIVWGADGWPSFATNSSAVGKQLGPAI
jgi:beta-xylosidase